MTSWNGKFKYSETDYNSMIAALNAAQKELKRLSEVYLSERKKGLTYSRKAIDAHDGLASLSVFLQDLNESIQTSVPSKPSEVQKYSINDVVLDSVVLTENSINQPNREGGEPNNNAYQKEPQSQEPKKEPEIKQIRSENKSSNFIAHTKKEFRSSLLWVGGLITLLAVFGKYIKK